MKTSGGILVWEVSRQRYGLPVSQVQEVLPRASLIHLPGAPIGMLGLLQLRGSLLPVVDLRQRLGLEPTAPRLDQCIVVMAAEAGNIGLLVDAVCGINPDEASRSERVSSPNGARMFHRVTLSSGEVVAVLNAGAIGGEVEEFLSVLVQSSSGAAEAPRVQAPSGQID